MRVFLDAQTGPWHPAAKAAFGAAADEAWADPRAVHLEGRRAAQALAAAREQVAVVLGCRTDEVVFDSSGAAASRRAIAGMYPSRRRIAPRIIASEVETASILQGIEVCRFADSGADQVDVAKIGVDHDGHIDIDALEAATSAPAAMACIQGANAETGVIQDDESVRQTLDSHGIPWLMDASALMPYSAIPEGWDIAVADATAWAGPTGVGIMAVRTSTRWRSPDYPSDAYEFGRVPGQPSVPAIAAAAAALTSMRAEVHATGARLRVLSARLREGVSTHIPHVQVHSAPSGCPHITSMSFLYVSAEALASRLDGRGFAIGSGSACANDLHTPSHVLAAMGRLTEGNVRITLPWDCTELHIDAFVDALTIEVAEVREMLGATEL